MILKVIELYNYRSFCGTNRLALPHPEADKPIHLIGGYNGFGKTSLHSAISAALFAQQESPMLRASDITHSPKWDGKHIARISLEMELDDKAYTLSRTWTRRIGKPESSLESLELSSILAETSGDFSTTNDEEIAEFIRSEFPETISDFFLFDGEAIKTYTDPRTSGPKVREALERLLGIHLYKVLSEDLIGVAREFRQERDNVDVEQDLTVKTERYEQTSVRLRTIETNKQQLKRTIGEYERKLRDLQLQQDKIAEVFDPESQARRRELETVRQRLESDVDRLQGRAPELITEAWGPSLFFNTLLAASSQAQLRGQHLEFPKTVSELTHFLWENKDSLPEVIRVADDPKELEPYIVKALFGADMPLSAPQATQDAVWLLQFLAPKLRELSEHHGRLSSDLVALQQTNMELNALPSWSSQSTDVADLNREVQQLQRLRQRDETQIATLSQEEENLKDTSQSLAQEINGLKVSSEQFSRLTRQIELCNATRDMLDSFIDQLTEAKVDELQSSLTKNFLRLTNIPAAIEAVEVDKSDYRLAIKFKQAHSLDASLGSAGQQEVLAFSLIWSLVQLSARNLPVIIDTPLARLDSVHRNHILRECFPLLGPQIIILATDEEIGRDELSLLNRFIISEHHLYFDQDTKSTSFEEGYIVD